MRRLLYLDQNAWIALAKGAWDRSAHPTEHVALANIVGAVKEQGLLIPLSFTNIYETGKINDKLRRMHLAWVQATLSGGYVLRGRRRILQEMLTQLLSSALGLGKESRNDDWFLSDIFFEAASDYTPETYGLEISKRVLEFIRQHPQQALFSFLIGEDDELRREAVRRYSAESAELIGEIEKRRQAARGECFVLRRKIYSASLLIDEFQFILDLANGLGLNWSSVQDLGGSLLKRLVSDVPVMNVERELAVRLEDQNRQITENDLRDVASFSTALPLVSILVGEKPLVNVARQARLGDKYGTLLLTSIQDVVPVL